MRHTAYGGQMHTIPGDSRPMPGKFYDSTRHLDAAVLRQRVVDFLDKHPEVKPTNLGKAAGLSDTYVSDLLGDRRISMEVRTDKAKRLLATMRRIEKGG